ncbi:MAG: hypothetical protein ACOYKZ_04180 [Chlamydiia bacterium]
MSTSGVGKQSTPDEAAVTLSEKIRRGDFTVDQVLGSTPEQIQDLERRSRVRIPRMLDFD